MQNIITRDDELMHYGVLGMKWGMHRAAMRGQEYHYKSMVTKHDEKKAAKLHAKADAERSHHNSMIAEYKKSGKNGMTPTDLAAVDHHTQGLAKASKIEKKAKMYDARAEAGRQWDKQRENYARTADTGAAIIRTALLAPSFNRQYENYRSMGHSKEDATNKMVRWGVASVSMAMLSGGTFTVVPNQYAHGSYVRKAAAMKAKNS